MTLIPKGQKVGRIKPKREGETAYTRSMRQRASVVSGQYGTEHETMDAAHFRWGTDGGTGFKPSEWYVNPLLHSEHMEQGRIGDELFWLRAIAKRPQILCEFIKDALKWRYFERTGKVPK